MSDLNTQLFFLIHNLSGKNKLMDTIMIFGAEAIIYITLILTVILGIFIKGLYLQALILSAISTPIALLLILVIHIFIKEKRPFLTLHLKPLISFYKNLSFPSTHTTFMSIIVFSQLFYHTEISLYLILLLLWLAFARIYSGLHYPIDILGGLITGLSSLLCALLIKNLL